ncbi:AAA family ATPase [Paenibacillus puldeungensis]|uniref:AAA family ATPase n=1 Tax=Paenibacillus puldeungensis TaxID=696536 RepID=A0ABW3RXN6_9BACL
MENHHHNESGSAGAETGQVVSDMTLRTYLNRFTYIEPEVFVKIARSMTACVGKLHQQQILHLDLRPERIAIHPTTLHVDLKDSEVAVYRTADGYIRPGESGASEASLPYCSPENTGRMQRPIDERSDLYSLGVIFYEMLAGVLPFQSDNPLEWIYMHLTQTPPHLRDRSQRLPDGLESIVMKLLEKNPDNRYQNTGYLIADLDKIGQFQQTLFIEQGFYGRENEISILSQAFYSTCLGSTEIVYVSGEAGIGKTSLIEEVFRKQQLTRNFFYITGKFEQISRESPYHAIIQAFRGLMRHLLGQRKDQIELWRQKLKIALGINANVITEIIPEAGLILGDTSPAEKLQAPETQKRFFYVFRKFVQVLATKEHPLVLVIDDLQWADFSSLQLIHALLCDPECQYLMFVCAYRDSEMDGSKLPGYAPDGRGIDQTTTVRQIYLYPLSLAQMNQIVMETLNSSAEDTLPLTELLYHQSKGNPFHFKQIWLRLQDDHILRYNEKLRCWKWDLGRIIEQIPSYAIDDLIEHKLSRLPAASQELLHVAACVGSSFEPHLIACVMDRPAAEMSAEWSYIEAEGLLLSSETDKFHFAHDNIQKLAYSRIDDISKQDIHIRIGRCLLERNAPDGDMSFDIVNHLNRGSQKIADDHELMRLIKLNLEAGNRAKASSAYDVALGFFNKAIELLDVKAWNGEFELTFELHAQKAECEYLCGNYEASNREIEVLLAHARSSIERSRVQMTQIMQYVNQGKYLESTALGLECLREHEIYISPNPEGSMLEMEEKRIDMLLQDQFDKLTHLEEMTDPDQIAAMNLIYAIIASTFFSDKKVFFLLICRAIELSLKHGNTPASAAIYSSFGMLLGISYGKYDKGTELAKIAIELSERYNVTSIKSLTYMMFGGVLCQFAGDAREGDDDLVKALRFGLDSGDYVYASYAMGAHVNSLYTRASLSDLAKTIAEYLTVLATTKDEFVRQNFFLYQGWIKALQGGTSAPDSFSDAEFNEEEFLNRVSQDDTAATSLFQYCTYKTQLCYLLGRFEESARWAEQAKGYENYATHLPHLPECLFYESLAVLAVYEPLQDISDKLYVNLRRFKTWAQLSPANFLPRRYLLEAEFSRAIGDEEAAEEMYDKALRKAREYDDIHTKCIASELAAKYYAARKQRKTALFYLHQTIDGYNEWELKLKTTELEELQREWQTEEEIVLIPKSEPIEAGLSQAAPGKETTGYEHQPAFIRNEDQSVILKMTQAIAGQPDTDAAMAEMMNMVMKYAGASKGALLVGSDDAPIIQIYADPQIPAISSPLAMNDQTMGQLPEGIIRYVFRTQEEIYYTSEEDSWLIHNPYFAMHHPQSALCIPVKVNSTMLGVLYLENRHTNGVFTPDRMSVLQSMASLGIMMCVLQSEQSPSLAEPELGEETQSEPDGMEENLTEREFEVLALLAAGLSNKEIADRLIIAIGTVKVHVKNIFAKLKVNRRTKAIAQAKELKLLKRRV